MRCKPNLDLIFDLGMLYTVVSISSFSPFILQRTRCLLQSCIYPSSFEGILAQLCFPYHWTRAEASSAYHTEKEKHSLHLADTKIFYSLLNVFLQIKVTSYKLKIPICLTGRCIRSIGNLLTLIFDPGMLSRALSIPRFSGHTYSILVSQSLWDSIVNLQLHGWEFHVFTCALLWITASFPSGEKIASLAMT